MIVGISDIQQEESPIKNLDKYLHGNSKITFCTYPDCEDFMELTLDRRTMWEIANYCLQHLSLGGERRRELEKYGKTHCKVYLGHK